MGTIQVSTLPLTRKIHCYLKAVEGEMVSIILSLIEALQRIKENFEGTS